MTRTVEDLVELSEQGKLNGFYEDISEEVYHDPECPGVSRSGLNQINRSYAHYLHYLESEGEKTDAMIFGSAVHDAILMPDLFASKYVQKPGIDRRTKVGKEKWQEFIIKHQGKQILSKNDMSIIRQIAYRFNAHCTCRELIEDAKCELSGWFIELGNLCKFRPDIYSPGEYIADIKTTADASAAEFRRTIAKYKYDKQAAFYQAGVKAITGEELPFYFIAIEKSAPFGIAIYQISELDLEVGRELYKRDLQRLTNVKVFGEEYGYPEGIQQIDMPAWGHDLSIR